jgi:hypothetical protein
MNEISIIDILITVSSAYAIWAIIIITLAYNLGFFGLIIGVVLPPLIGYSILPVETATTLVSFTYLALLISLLLEWYLLTFGKEYPYKIEDINIGDIKLSDENLKLLHQANTKIEKLHKNLKKIKSLDLTKRQDGYYSERSRAGKEANTKWKELKNSISSMETTKSNLIEKQTNYRRKWIDIQEIRNYQNALNYSLLLSLIGLLLVHIFYKPSFLIFIQDFIGKYSQIQWLSSFDSAYFSLLELSGIVTLSIFPLLAFLFNIINNPYGKRYDSLKELFYKLNYEIYSPEEQKTIV